MNIRMSSGKLIVCGNILTETLSGIRSAIIFDMIDKINKHENGLNDFPAWILNEVSRIVLQLPAGDLGKYFKLLLFNYIRYTFNDFVEQIRQEEICTKSIKKGGENR